MEPREEGRRGQGVHERGPRGPESAPLAWAWPPPRGCRPLTEGPRSALEPPQGAGHQGLSSPALCAWGRAELQEGVRPAHDPRLLEA